MTIKILQSKSNYTKYFLFFIVTYCVSRYTFFGQIQFYKTCKKSLKRLALTFSEITHELLKSFISNSMLLHYIYNLHRKKICCIPHNLFEVEIVTSFKNSVSVEIWNIWHTLLKNVLETKTHQYVFNYTVFTTL